MKVFSIMLNCRASVSVPRDPQEGQATSAGSDFVSSSQPGRSSARKRFLQLRQSTIGSVKLARWPDACQTAGLVICVASMP
jgi:hypothetical protein